VIESLLSKYEALSSNPSSTNIYKKKKKVGTVENIFDYQALEILPKR
jgi:hypothetical protein